MRELNVIEMQIVSGGGHRDEAPITIEVTKPKRESKGGIKITGLVDFTYEDKHDGGSYKLTCTPSKTDNTCEKVIKEAIKDSRNDGSSNSGSRISGEESDRH